ncbi:hypothetical protein AGABI1DRAFT_64645 [Agaricus bisporus var. burnettii JB137-S8]|uniref:Uncharacterized protein n=1 Tax=Agaricus bisporus var. burnettii (strain JB137-S8 / ATCC MYA-4627 / FGSC 10392) TaxID=597362 RepID=K5VLW4_AGABU|nr:uncharacterized protein AGABI1DRAFT_64645 [Agaricus bisporus var. burnettii JB137-S8]EKM75414.1 hypothetical protein AGABI1DRAFT_64645 [Agaricus bisporus var. burnettii JB137-S8]
MASYHASSDREHKHWFMASMQNTRKAVLPVHTQAERDLFRSLMETEPSFSPRSGGPCWNDAVIKWNEYAEKTDGVYYKLVEHLKVYSSKWNSLLHVKEALSLTSNARQPLTKLIHDPSRSSNVPPVLPTIPHPLRVELGQLEGGTVTRDSTRPLDTANLNHAMASRYFPDSTLLRAPSVALEMRRSVVEPETHQAQIGQTTRRRRTCRKCALPDCKGKRAVVDCRNKCQDCGEFQCRGRNSRKLHLTCREGWD